MATTKTSELREQSTEALQERLEQLRLERFNMRIASATQTVDNPIRFRMIRRDIARILTILRERSATATPSAGQG